MPPPRLPARGCRDVLPATARTRRILIDLFARHAALFNFREIETPVIEPASIFASLGATSDVVAKETYHVRDTDPPLVLRPEGTAGVARALQAHLTHSTTATRLWYAGPMFRRERPQAGRLRQFTQLGVELLHDGRTPAKITKPTVVSVLPLASEDDGQRNYDSDHDDACNGFSSGISSSSRSGSTGNSAYASKTAPERGRVRETVVDATAAAYDALVVELAARYLEAAGVPFRLRLNWLGGPGDRAQFSAALADFLAGRRTELSAASQARLDKGACLRVLDSDDPADRAALTNAPRLSEYISPGEQAHASLVRDILREGNVPFNVDDTLVRGLDYYTGTAFEFDGERDSKAICAGGRYADVVGGVNGVGFALGLERVERAIAFSGSDAYSESEASGDGMGHRLDGCVAVASHGQSSEAVRSAVRRIARSLRADGIAAEELLGGGKIGKVLGRAVRHGARAVVMIGREEAQNGTALVKLVEAEASGGEQAVTVREEAVGQVVKVGGRSGKDPLQAVLN